MKLAGGRAAPADRCWWPAGGKSKFISLIQTDQSLDQNYCILRLMTNRTKFMKMKAQASD
eukprot:6204422-Pleurochrysis_carterae.AAC.4